MNHHVSIDEVAEIAKYSKKTLMNWVKKEHLIPPFRLNKLRGWELSYLQTHKYLQYFFKAYIPPNPLQKKEVKLDLVRKSFYKGYSVNCANNRPLIKRLIDKLINGIDLLLRDFKKPIGIVLTLSDGERAAKQIQKLKQRLSKRLELSVNDIYHWRKDEVGDELERHCHVVIMLDAQKANEQLNKIRDTISKVVETMGSSVYMNYSNEHKKKGLHIINTEQDKNNFTHHASYLAKKKTTEKGKRVLFCSHNIPKS